MSALRIEQDVVRLDVPVDVAVTTVDILKRVQDIGDDLDALVEREAVIVNQGVGDASSLVPRHDQRDQTLVVGVELGLNNWRDPGMVERLKKPWF